jgi:hypothetical protein
MGFNRGCLHPVARVRSGDVGFLSVYVTLRKRIKNPHHLIMGFIQAPTEMNTGSIKIEV